MRILDYALERWPLPEREPDRLPVPVRHRDRAFRSAQYRFDYAVHVCSSKIIHALSSRTPKVSKDPWQASLDRTWSTVRWFWFALHFLVPASVFFFFGHTDAGKLGTVVVAFLSAVGMAAGSPLVWGSARFGWLAGVSFSNEVMPRYGKPDAWLSTQLVNEDRVNLYRQWSLPSGATDTCLQVSRCRATLDLLTQSVLATAESEPTWLKEPKLPMSIWWATAECVLGKHGVLGNSIWSTSLRRLMRDVYLAQKNASPAVAAETLLAYPDWPVLMHPDMDMLRVLLNRASDAQGARGYSMIDFLFDWVDLIEPALAGVALFTSENVWVGFLNHLPKVPPCTSTDKFSGHEQVRALLAECVGSPEAETRRLVWTRVCNDYQYQVR